MEYIVQMCTRRELQSIRHIANVLPHLEGPEVFRPELVVVGDVDGRCRSVNEVEPNPLTDVEREVVVSLVVEVLVVLLCLRQPLQPMSGMITGEAAQIHRDNLVHDL
jgi:hypothetical protein